MNFIAELVARLFSGKPGFFKILQIVALVIGAISAVLAYLNGQGVSLPGAISWIGDAVVYASSFVAALIAQLPNPNPPANNA